MSLKWRECLLVLVLLTAGSSEVEGQSSRQRLSDVQARLATYSQRLNILFENYVIPVQMERSYRLESRLADGRLLFMLGDYPRASIVFLDIIQMSQEGRPGYQDARYFLAESLFRCENYVAARGYFQELVADSYSPHRQEALGRLLEIAITTRRYEDLQWLYEAIRATGGQVSPQIMYIRGKALYYQGEYSRAAMDFGQVPSESVPYVQAMYLMGLSYAQLEEWDSALAAFDGARLGSRNSQNPHAPEIGNLANLALGRVHFELMQYEDALDAYQRVSRTSAHLDVALYEMTWVYMKLENHRDALRVLEILSLAAPDSRFMPRVQLLRGDLLIRTIRYGEAMSIFEHTVARYGPLEEQIGAMLSQSSDLRQYHRAMGEDGGDSILVPDLVREWISSDESMRRGMNLMRNLTIQSEELLQSREIILELEAVLDSANPIEIFPELRSGFGQAVEIRYGLLATMSQLLELEAGLVRPLATGANLLELQELQSRREWFEGQLAGLPLTYDQIHDRERTTADQIRQLEMEVFRLGFELDTQTNQLNAMRQQLREDHAEGRRTVEEVRALNASLEEYTTALSQLAEARDELRRDLERERLQTGVASITGGSQEQIVSEYQEVMAEEARLLSLIQSEASTGDRAILEEIDSLRMEVDVVQRELARFLDEMTAIVEVRRADIVHQVDVQRALLEVYESQLLEYREESEQLSGLIAYESLSRVQEQYHDLVLRADVGIVDVAWREKEERTTRIDSLLNERDGQLRILDAEFREVLQAD